MKLKRTAISACAIGILAALALRFVGRSSKKSLVFIRDISIPIITLLSVAAIVYSINSNLFALSSLAGEEKFLLIRSKTFDNSSDVVSLSIVDHVESIDSNIEDVLPTTTFVVPGAIQDQANSDQKVYTNLTIVEVNRSHIREFWSEQIGDLNDFDVNEVAFDEAVIGEDLAGLLGLYSGILPQKINLQVPESGEVSMNITRILKGKTIYSSQLLVENEFLCQTNDKYCDFCTYIYIKVFDPKKIGNTKKALEDYAAKAESAQNLDVSFVRGSPSLLGDIFHEILDKMQLFYIILTIIVAIRIFEAVQWLRLRYEVEIALMLSIGFNRESVFFLIVILGIILGNLGIIFSIFLSLIIPTGVLALISIFTMNFIKPTVFGLMDLLSYLFVLNVLFIATSCVPAIQSAQMVIRTKFSREGL